MTQDYPLDRLIRFKSPDRPEDKRPIYKKEKVVHILERTGEIIPYRQVSSQFRMVKTYIVNRENTAEHETKCVVNDVTNDRKITLIIKYKIRCLREKKTEQVPPGKRVWNYFTKEIRQTLKAYHINYERGYEDQMVRALYKEAHPALALHKLIKIWIREYRQECGDKAFIVDFFKNRKHLQKILKERAAGEVGAHFIPRIKLEHEDEWEPIPIISDNVECFLRGGDDKLNFKFKTELHRDLEPDRHIYALARRHRLPKIKAWMPGKIAAFLNSDCVLHEFFFKPRIYLREKIVKHLNDTLLKDEGRHITGLTFEPTFEFEPPNPQMTQDFTVDIDVEGESNKITFTYRLVMVIQDLDRFRVFKFPDFDQWFTDRLRFVTRNNFHSRTYTEHLIEFASRQKEIEENIKSQVSFWAELVGYSLEEINIITDFEKLRYKEGYRFEIEAQNVVYSTQNNRIKVQVDLDIQGSIRNLYAFIKDVSWRFKNDVEAATKEYLLEQLKYKILATPPEKFYSHIFDYERPEGGLAILKELRLEIVSILELWDTGNIKVNVKLLEIEPVKRIKALRQGTYPFEATAFPYASEGYGEKIVFDGKFVVIGISEAHWSIFTARKYDNSSDEISDIATYLKDRISREVNTIPKERLQDSNREDLPEIAAIIKENVRNIEKVFGVTIRVVHFNRRPILSEEVAFQQQQVFTRISTWVNGVRKNILNGKKGDSARG